MVTVVDNEAMGLELGASNYLIKPVNRDRLAVLVEKHRITRSTTITDDNPVPLSYVAERPAGSKTAGTRLPGAGETRMPKILLVEDNEMNRDMLSRRLQRKGYSVVTAEDGEKGLSLARSETPDLILMDISLPVMGGWEVTRLLKANESTRHIPIIALTAHAWVTDREKAIEAGCDDYDTKPVEFGRLSEKIESLLTVKK